MKIDCPHCCAKAHISHSESITPEMKEVYCNCTNPGCMARFVMTVAHKHDIIPPRQRYKNVLLEALTNLHPEDLQDLLTKVRPVQQTLF